VAAAELAFRVVIDEVSGARSLPGSLAEVRRASLKPPSIVSDWSWPA
jgi:hypothetical protein